MDRLRVLRENPLLAPVKSQRSAQITAYVDGAARGNPGPAAAGVVFLKDEKTVKTLSVPIGNNTNNVAEYCALILALQEALMMGVRELQVFTDSELVTKQFNGEYKVKHPDMLTLWRQASTQRRAFEMAEIKHVRREQNKEADALANRAMDLQDSHLSG